MAKTIKKEVLVRASFKVLWHSSHHIIIRKIDHKYSGNGPGFNVKSLPIDELVPAKCISTPKWCAAVAE